MDKPKNKKELLRIIDLYFSEGQTDLNDINTSLITDMSGLFIEIDHDFDISGWNTEKVKNMRGMFYRCPEFNSNIRKWNTRKVTDMARMFCGCTSFNQDIREWCIKKVTSMKWMFYSCQSFKQDLSSWCIREKDTNKMFFNCPGMRELELRPRYFNLYKL